MSKDKKKQMGVLGLVVGLVVVLFGGVLFMGAVSGWFDNSVVLDSEYFSDNADFMEISADEYEELVQAKKSFVVFIDQDGCTTADRLKGYMSQYMKEAGFSAFKIMFSDVKKSSLHNEVKYYPSVALVDKGTVIAYLRADSDEDADFYNNYDAFKAWLEKYLR